ncbi:hypothetical protein K7432_011179 [Basidiobolus ranarum]|uniref:Uncharacterized protein n=1 Tax=Basidiobolus ranarum TaxID=34480 RepID=A0ABR2WMN4_9FUNG
MEQPSSLVLINNSIQQLHLLISQVATIYQKLSEYKVIQTDNGQIEDETEKEVEKLKEEYTLVSKRLRECLEALNTNLSQEKVEKDVNLLRDTRDKLREEALEKSAKVKLILDRCYQLRFISSSILAASETK